ncbi:hypothetical protein KM043_007344 [Ampulex compressa]|nr:hypothetical protein KM043_007344 [Ampulex compressa]
MASALRANPALGRRSIARGRPRRVEAARAARRSDERGQARDGARPLEQPEECVARQTGFSLAPQFDEKPLKARDGNCEARRLAATRVGIPPRMLPVIEGKIGTGLFQRCTEGLSSLLRSALGD